jgi:hypothetical protein
MSTQIKFTRINNDTNGNPRYVCHFLNLLTDIESNNYDINVSEQYNMALQRAKKIGGKKFHNKQYGGGIVFQSYNISETEKNIQNLLK